MKIKICSLNEKYNGFRVREYREFEFEDKEDFFIAKQTLQNKLDRIVLIGGKCIVNRDKILYIEIEE